MKKCTIHIGMHKTGSTSIQNSFWKKLNNEQWKYADIGIANHGHLLQSVLHGDLPKQNRHSDEPTDWDDIIEKMKRSKMLTKRLIRDIQQEGGNYLISGEWLSSEPVEFCRLLEFKALISSYVKRISIVAYVRPPKSYMESAFQERLKRSAAKLNFESLCPKYRQRLEKFDFAFGKKNVSFWKFDPKTFKNRCVVQDFCEHLGIVFPEELIIRTNESLSREAIALLYTYRKYANRLGNNRVFSQGENLMLVARLAELKGSKLRFATKAVQTTLDNNRENIQWMEQRIGASLTELYEDSADAIHSERDLLCYHLSDLMWLAQQLGGKYIDSCHAQMKPKEVAEWMLQLHLKLISAAIASRTNLLVNTKVKSGHITVKLEELVQHAKESSPSLKTLSDEQAIDLLTDVFKQIAEHSEDIDDGTLTITRLGKFHIKQIQREKNGQQVSTKRIVFHATKDKQLK